MISRISLYVVVAALILIAVAGVSMLAGGLLRSYPLQLRYRG